MSRISSLPGFTVVPNWSMRAAHSRAASVLLGAFSRRLMVDCEASASPLSGQRPTASFIKGMAQPIEVISILVAARDRRYPRHQHFEHCVSDATLIAPIRYGVRKQPAYTDRALRLSQQQNATIGGLVAALKINCEFLAADRWKVERKQRIVGHGGCGGALMQMAIRLNTDLLRESRSWRYSRRKILRPDELSGLMRPLSVASIVASGRFACMRHLTIACLI